MKTDAELSLLEAPWPPFDFGPNPKVRQSVTRNEFQQAAFTKFPGINSEQFVPEGLTDEEGFAWRNLMMAGLEAGDPDAPRYPRVLLETLAEEKGHTPHLLEFMLYGPKGVPYSARLSINQQYELRQRAVELELENARNDERRNAQSAQGSDAEGAGAGATG